MALAEAVREIRGSQTIPLFDDEVAEIASGMPDYERDSIIRLDQLKEVLFQVREEPWTLLQTPQGDLSFDHINFALITHEGMRKRPVSMPITYQQFFQLAQAAGTDVRGIVRAFSNRDEVLQDFSEDEHRKLDEIADVPLPIAYLEESHIKHIITDNHLAIYHWIFN